MSSSVLCYGEIGVDNLIQVEQIPTPEIAVFPQGDTYHIGGAAANTGVWLAALGVPVRVAGNAIGTDLYGDWLWGWLTAHDWLDVSAVERRDGVTTPFTRTMVTPNGDRHFLIFGYPQAPKTPLTRDLLADAAYLPLDLYGGEERLAAARLAHEAGVQTVIGDVVWPDHPALPYSDITINSAAFVRALFPDVAIEAHMQQIQAQSGGLVIATDGGGAVRALTPDGRFIVVQPPAVEPVDATGAGDAFRAGLVDALLQGERLVDALRWAIGCGAFKVQHLGAATALPTRAQVAALADAATVLS